MDFCVRSQFFFGGVSAIGKKNAQQLNEEIRDPEVRVISDNGEQLGIMSSKDAQKIADSKGLDLVKISPTAVPPVCKIMDYNKFMYEKAKKEKEAKKNQKVTVLKEVQLSLNIEDHDLNTKMNHAKRFLGDGNKVKVALKLRSREIQRPELGLVLMEKFANGVSELGIIEKPAKLEGRTMIMILAAKPAK